MRPVAQHGRSAADSASDRHPDADPNGDAGADSDARSDRDADSYSNGSARARIGIGPGTARPRLAHPGRPAAHR